MTQENKELLLKDLCARLPYKVKCCIYNFGEDTVRIKEDVLWSVQGDNILTLKSCVEKGEAYMYHQIKPYLFPLSSMTDEQKREFYKFFEEGITESANETRQWLRTKRADETMRPITIAYVMVHKLVIEWLNKNHFDYRGLIEKGLALDATGLNIY